MSIDIERLIRALGDSDPAIRVFAISALEKSRDSRAIAPLTMVHYDSDNNVRRRAIQALENLKRAPNTDPPVVTNDTSLLGALAKFGEVIDKAQCKWIKAGRLKDRKTRGQTGDPIMGREGETENPYVIERLSRDLRDGRGSSSRLKAMEELRKIGGPLASAALVRALADDNSQIRRRGAKALVKIGAPAIEALWDGLRSTHKNVRRICAAILIEIGPSTQERLIELLDESRKAGLSGIAHITAIEILGRIGDSRSTETLVSALSDFDSVVRSQAALALASVGDERAVEALIACLNDTDLYVRSYSANALGSCGDERAVLPLVEALSDEVVTVRTSAAQALYWTGDARAVAALTKCLADDNINVRTNAVKALGIIGDARAVEALCIVIGAGDKLVRREITAAALGMIGDEGVLPRKILLCDKMSLHGRIAALNALKSNRAAYFEHSVAYVYNRELHQFMNCNAQQHCEWMKFDPNPEIREGAAAMLHYLLSAETLLRPSRLDDSSNGAELIRPASGDHTDDAGEALLRSANNAPHQEPE